MNGPLRVTLISEDGDEHPTVLQQVTGPLNESEWRAVIGIEPTPENPKRFATLQIDEGEYQGYLAAAWFIAPGRGGAVIGLTAFQPPPTSP
jgi:hypothetical protein